MPFPEDRLRRAGASAEQLDKLESTYADLSPAAQASFDARIEPLSDYQVADEYLTDSEDVSAEQQSDAEDTEPEASKTILPGSTSPSLSGSSASKPADQGATASNDSI